MPSLRDATLALERGVNEILGDRITYDPAFGAAVTFNAWVEFDTNLINPNNSAGSIDFVQIEVPIATIAMPTEGDRITISILPGQLFTFKERLRGETGATWVLPLKRVAS